MMHNVNFTEQHHPQQTSRECACTPGSNVRPLQGCFVTGDIGKAYSEFNALRDDRDSRYSEREAFKMVLGPIIAEQSALDQAMTAGLHQLRTEHQALTDAPDSRAVVACDPARGLGAAVDAVAEAWAARAAFGKGEPNWMRLLATCYFAWTGGDDLAGPMAAAKRALFGADTPARRLAAAAPTQALLLALPTQAQVECNDAWHAGYCARVAGMHVKLRKTLDREANIVDYVADPFKEGEIVAILAAAEGQERALFQFAFATGMRPSEYLALEWAAIDMARGTINVERVVVFGVQRDEMKSRSGRRTIEMRRGAYNALLAQQAITGVEGGRVFLNPITNKGWTGAGQLLHRWKDILGTAKVRYRNQYQTRHTFASTLLSTGENLMYVAKQMGHADIRMIVTTYWKWLEQVGGTLPDFSARVAPKKITPLLKPA